MFQPFIINVIAPDINIAPIVNFSYSPSVLTMVNQTIIFTDESTDIDGEIVSWLWDFGDGTSSTLQNPTHIYTQQGTYTITLTVKDNLNATNSKNQNITIYGIFTLNWPPNAEFTYSMTLLTMMNGETLVTFTDESTDIDGEIVSWLWDFGDGTSSTLQNPTHTYSNTGYAVTLTVTDDDGLTDSVSKQIGQGSTIIIPPNAEFTYYPSMFQQVNQKIIFTDKSTDLDGKIVSWLWNFGDGNSSTEQNPIHSFSRVDLFVINLTVIDNSGNTDYISKEIPIHSTSLISVNGTLSYITISPNNQEPIKIDNISLGNPYYHPYFNLTLYDLIYPKMKSPLIEIFDYNSYIQNDILSKDIAIIEYFQTYPEDIKTISNEIMNLLKEKPVLLDNLTLLAEAVSNKLISNSQLAGYTPTSIYQTIPNWLINLILKIIGYFIPAKPGIDITYIGSGIGNKTIDQMIKLYIDNSDTAYGITIVEDGNIIGYIGEGWFTWPGNYDQFSVSFSTMGTHYVIAYPTILEEYDSVRNKFTSGFIVALSEQIDSNHIIIPGPENISRNLKIQPVENETSSIQTKIIRENKLINARFTVDLNQASTTIEINNVKAVTKETIEIRDNIIYMDISSGKKILKILPDEAINITKITNLEKIEIIDNINPTYKIVGKRNSNLLWFIPSEMEVTIFINAENGKIEKMEKPWWGFLAS